MPACFDVLMLQEYVDDQLDRVGREAVSAHLDDCDPCRRLVAGLRAVSHPLRHVAATPPDDLQGRIFDAVAGVKPLPVLTCEQALEMLSEAADGRLDHVAVQQLEAHVLACAACYRAARRQDALVTALREIVAEPAPAGLLPRLRTAVETVAPRRTVRQPVGWRRWAVGAAGMAAAAAILLAVLLHGPAVTTLPGGSTVAVAPAMPTVPPTEHPTRPAPDHQALPAPPATPILGAAAPLTRLPRRGTDLTRSWWRLYQPPPSFLGRR